MWDMESCSVEARYPQIGDGRVRLRVQEGTADAERADRRDGRPLIGKREKRAARIVVADVYISAFSDFNVAEVDDASLQRDVGYGITRFAKS